MSAMPFLYGARYITCAVPGCGRVKRKARQEHSPSDVYWSHYLDALDHEADFERFATLPHYDEPQP